MIVPDSLAEESPQERASCLSRLLLVWYLPLLWRQKASKVSKERLLPLGSENDVDFFTAQLKKEWAKEVGKPKPNFMRAVLRTFKRQLFLCSLPLALEMTFHISGALLIREILTWLNAESASDWEGYLYALGISLVSLGLACCKSFSSRRFQLLGGLVKTVIIEVLFDKTLGASLSELNKPNSSTLVNIVSQNLDNLELLEQASMLVYAPVFVVVCTGVLCWILSWVGLVVTGVTLLLVPVQNVLLKIMVKFIIRVAKCVDERVGLLNVVIEGTKLIKMYAWCEAMEKKVEQLRLYEEKAYLGQYKTLSCAFSITLCGHSLILLVSYVVYSQVWEMNVPDLMGVWTLILSEHYYVNVTLAFALFLLSSYKVTAGRIAQILLQQNRSEKCVRTENEKVAVEAKNLSATWKTQEEYDKAFSSRMETGSAFNMPPITRRDSGDSSIGKGRRRSSIEMTTCTIQMCSFRILHRKLSMIVGATGSGKSSLLMTLLGELNIVEGSLNVSGSIAYVEQEPWLFAGTVRDNILLGKQYDEVFYNGVVSACSLTEDFDQMSSGDQTVLGGKGVNLSGGQKARIALARALYSDRDVYLLDDPLSAVDVSVAADLFSNAIKDFLEYKTVVLVTHQTQFAAEADQILAINQGTVIFSGTYEEASQDSFCQSLIAKHQKHLNERTFSRRGSLAFHSLLPMTQKKDEKLAALEETKSERIPFSLYLKLFRNAYGTLWILLPLLAMNGLFQTAYLAVPYWMTHWASQTWEEQQKGLYPGILLVIFVLSYCFGLTRAWFLFGILLRSSSNFHNAIVKSLLNTGARFFDLTPVGQILTVLTRDIMCMDSELMTNTFELQEIGFMMLGYFIIIVILNPYTLIAFAVSGVLIVLILTKSAPVARELRRLYITTKSPILSQISSTVSGIVSVRAYAVSAMINEVLATQTRLNLQAYAHYTLQMACALLYMNLCAVILIIANSFLVAGLKGSLDPNIIGIGLSFTMMILTLLSWSASKVLNWGNLMTSVQHIDSFTNLDPEEAQPGKRFAISQGELRFDNVHMRYSPELEDVLQGLSFVITPGAKVGVVGRTGAGKSSLISVIFRLVPVQQGSILIDGQDISAVNLHDLRSELSVIPQQPFLFSGSIRENLDLLGRHTDDELWAALKSVELETYFMELPGGLEASVTRGLSLSVGQKQLLCLARATLRCNKILLMDEPTANVDKGTDDLIQRKIREKFVVCTVVTIAHRIRTVIDNDRIIVMDAGVCVEFDSPINLLDSPHSVFSSLVTATGLEESAYLRSLAIRSSLR